jgi:hypothetical protein
LRLLQPTHEAQFLATSAAIISAFIRLSIRIVVVDIAGAKQTPPSRHIIRV